MQLVGIYFHSMLSGRSLVDLSVSQENTCVIGSVALAQKPDSCEPEKDGKCEDLSLWTYFANWGLEGKLSKTLSNIMYILYF